jgi:phage terminase small subunit
MSEEVTKIEEIKISEQEIRWAESYVKHLNATQACRDAGYENKSEGALRQQGLRNVTNPNIQRYITEVLRYQEKKKEGIATIEEVMEFYSEGMRGKIKDQFGLDAMLSDRVKCANSLDKILTMAERAKQEEKRESISIEQYYGRDDADEE